MNPEYPQSMIAQAADSNPWEAGAPQSNEANPWEAGSPEPAPSNPWESGTPEPAPSNPWESGAAADRTQVAPAAESGANDWLDAGGTASNASDTGFDLMNPFGEALIPLDVWVNQGLNYVVEHARPAFQAVRLPIDATLMSIESALLSIPALLMLAILGLLAWQAGSRRLAIGTVISFALIGLIGAWTEAMITLSLVLTSVVFCIVIGLPLGIAIARNDRLEAWMRPVLDTMQTTPAFVYLVPVVMLFGIGNVPGVVVTIVFALPPLIRLTNLGIRQVRPDLIEASHSFGASPWQMLRKVQLPLAMPTIMAGVNQTLMLSLSMVVIASMIAVGGLGQMVLRGIGRLDMGLATIGGLGIVLMAIVLDRITQSMGRSPSEGGKGQRRWTERGPVGLVRGLFVGRKNQPSTNAKDAN